MKDGQQAMFHPGGNSNNATPSPGRVEKNVHSPWTAPRDRKKHRRAHSSGLPEVDEEALQQGAPWAGISVGGHNAMAEYCVTTVTADWQDVARSSGGDAECFDLPCVPCRAQRCSRRSSRLQPLQHSRQQPRCSGACEHLLTCK